MTMSNSLSLFNFVDAAGFKIAGCNITRLATDSYSRQITSKMLNHPGASLSEY